MQVMRNLQLCVICFLLFVYFEPAASSIRFGRKGRLSRSTRVSGPTAEDSTDQRGGFSLKEKQNLFSRNKVFIASSLHHLVFQRTGSSLVLRSDFMIQDVAVCEGRQGGRVRYFMCPVDIPAEVVGNWSSHAQFMMSPFYESEEAKLFCCELPKQQFCCDEAAYKREMDARMAKVIRVVLIIVLIVVIIVIIACIAFCCVCCFCFRKLGSGFGSSVPMFGGMFK